MGRTASDFIRVCFKILRDIRYNFCSPNLCVKNRFKRKLSTSFTTIYSYKTNRVCRRTKTLNNRLKSPNLVSGPQTVFESYICMRGAACPSGIRTPAQHRSGWRLTQLLPRQASGVAQNPWGLFGHVRNTPKTESTDYWRIHWTFWWSVQTRSAIFGGIMNSEKVLQI